ncbi:metallophosphoesterase [Pseudomonadota bacterium]|nr:metallophosphoesterase [Pseudomonadota bacterium]
MRKKRLIKIFIAINVIPLAIFLAGPSEFTERVSSVIQDTRNILTISYLKKRISFNNNYDICDIPVERKIKPSTIIISGHTYNKEQREYLIAQKLMELIINNKVLLDAVYLTGDIFFDPTASDWKLLNSAFKNLDIQLQIAPGNHDVGFNDSIKKKVFYSINKYDYPFAISDQFSIHIFDDTTIQPWSYQDATFRLAKKHADVNKTLFLFGHNITISELQIIANSNEGKPTHITEFNAIAERLSPLYKNIYLISGDTGAFEKLPTTLCIKNNNVSYVVQGIKNHGKNEVLLINNNQLSKIKL